jgi:hypothetical protein
MINNILKDREGPKNDQINFIQAESIAKRKKSRDDISYCLNASFKYFS